VRPRTLTFDIETGSATEKWERTPESMFRLGGYAWGDGPVQLTTSLEEMRAVLRRADKIIGHNIHQFDLIVVFGKDSSEPLQMALDDKIYDTWSDAPVVLPYPESYEHYTGVVKGCSNPESAKPFYSLNNLAFQLGTVAKTNSVSDLAKKWGGYDEIPVDDPEFREYLVGDVVASRELARLLLAKYPWSEYRKMEQRKHGILAQISRTGIPIDAKAARERIQVLEDRKAHHLSWLERDYGFPTTGKAPLRSNPGKAAVLAALASVGVHEDDLPRTKGGAPSMGGDAVKAAAKDKGDAAEALAESIAAISGARMTAEMLLRNRSSDGRAHPDITALQRSGRFSFTNPGLTVVGARGDGANDRKIIAAAPGHLIVEFDFAGADTRAVAGYSGDEAFYRDYVLGDPHTATAKLIWPNTGLLPNGRHPLRQEAKPVTHGSPYGIGANRLHKMTGLPVATAKRFLENLARTYPDRTAWQRVCELSGKLSGQVTSAWGRRLPVDVGRAYTQSTAQLGQNCTREMLMEGLLALPVRLMCRVIGIIHDAVLFELSEDTIEEDMQIITDAFRLTFHPKDGIAVPFEMEAGEPGKTWFEGSH
jgi:DNA polymerase-1